MQLHRLHREPHWHNAETVPPSAVPETIRQWLLDNGSLTQKLLDKSQGQLTVEILSQHITRARHSENRALGVGCRRWMLVREVALKGKGTHWVYARTAIPLKTLKGPLRRLRYLGTRPLGGQLFADPHMRRGAIDIAAINPEHLHQALSDSMPIWGRRSVFTLSKKPLLVSEIFLDALID